MTRQEWFDTSVRGLRAQGGPSVCEVSGFCVYRGPEGRKCAIGFLIPDEKYDILMEQCSPVNSDRVAGALGIDRTSSDARFLAEMQGCIHDGLKKDWSGFEQAVIDFAKAEVLEVP